MDENNNQVKTQPTASAWPGAFDMLDRVFKGMKTNTKAVAVVVLIL